MVNIHVLLHINRFRLHGALVGNNKPESLENLTLEEIKIFWSALFWTALNPYYVENTSPWDN